MPYFEPSRPMPLSSMPPKGAIAVEMIHSSMPTIPNSSASGHPPNPAVVEAVEAGSPVPEQRAPG
jgi:hypothetical protein